MDLSENFQILTVSLWILDFLPEGLVKKYGTKFREAINNPNSEDCFIYNLFSKSIQKENIMSTELQVELTPESTKIYFLRSQLQDLIDTTDWDIFKSKDTLVPTLEVQAMLTNAVKKLTKINVNFVTEEK